MKCQRGGEANVGAPLVQPGLEGLSFDGSGEQVKIVRVHPACGVRVRGLHVADGSGHRRRSRARVACCLNLSSDERRLRERVSGVHDERKASDGCRRDGAGAHVTIHAGHAGGRNAGLGQDGKVARGAEVNQGLGIVQLSGRKSRGTGAVEVDRQEQRTEGEHRAVEHVVRWDGVARVCADLLEFLAQISTRQIRHITCAPNSKLRVRG
eukprot:scaffold64302_cov82-Phaeocystis_antarctica.AAC.2